MAVPINGLNCVKAKVFVTNNTIKHNYSKSLTALQSSVSKPEVFSLNVMLLLEIVVQMKDALRFSMLPSFKAKRYLF